jgi:hypothetical protein
MPSEPETLVPTGQMPARAPPTRPALGAHFAGGALESAADILGATSAAVFAAGLVLPYIAAVSAPKMMDGRALFAISALALAFSMFVGFGAVVLKGLAHCAPHGHSARAGLGADR